MYYNRLIDSTLSSWAKSSQRKTLLVRGARQVGKSWAVRHLGEQFDNFVEVNFEKNPEYKQVFELNLDVHRIVQSIAVLADQPIVPGKTLLFLDEIQECEKAIMALRFFTEELPELHVVAAGSLLEFALAQMPTFGVGRIHSVFMHPMTFDEFISAQGMSTLLTIKQNASAIAPLEEPIHNKLVNLFREYLLVGGMPQVVSTWIETHDFLNCQTIQDDLILSYEDDFAKYKKNVDPTLLRMTFRSVATQVTKKFVYSQVGAGYRIENVHKALNLLTMAGLILPVTKTSANGLPLGAEADSNYQKMLVFDSGILLRLLNMSFGDISEITTQILTATADDLVNKGQVAELVAGLELYRYQSLNMQHALYYWTREERNSTAEVDYVEQHAGKVLPIEIKAGKKGGMKSLWLMMRTKHLHEALRCSLENFGALEYVDAEEEGASYRVTIIPLYALSKLKELKTIL